MIAFVAITTYLIMIGFLWPRMLDRFSNSDDPELCAGACSIFWPISLPIFVGGWASNIKYTPRAQRKRAREIANAKHEAELARIKRVAVEELERELHVLGK